MPVGIYFFKVENGNIRTMNEICSFKVNNKDNKWCQWCGSLAFIVIVEQISQINSICAIEQVNTGWVGIFEWIEISFVYLDVCNYDEFIQLKC